MLFCPRYSRRTGLISWLLMPWRHKESGHQQSCYRLCGINNNWSLAPYRYTRVCIKHHDTIKHKKACIGPYMILPYRVDPWRTERLTEQPLNTMAAQPFLGKRNEMLSYMGLFGSVIKRRRGHLETMNEWMTYASDTGAQLERDSIARFGCRRSDALPLQGSQWRLARPMRGGVTMWRPISLAEPIPKGTLRWTRDLPQLIWCWLPWVKVPTEHLLNAMLAH